MYNINEFWNFNVIIYKYNFEFTYQKKIESRNWNFGSELDAVDCEVFNGRTISKRIIKLMYGFFVNERSKYSQQYIFDSSDLNIGSIFSLWIKERFILIRSSLKFVNLFKIFFVR